MLTQLHAKNSFASKEGWQKVSKEEVIKQNPDVMIGTMGISKENTKKVLSNAVALTIFRPFNMIK